LRRRRAAFASPNVQTLPLLLLLLLRLLLLQEE